MATAQRRVPVEEILLREYDVTTRETVSRIDGNAKTTGLAFAVLVAGFTFGSKEHADAARIAAPFAVFAVLFYSILNTTVIFALGGYRRHLADQLNKAAGEDLAVWVPIASQLIVPSLRI